ncbi:hypothetical protein EKM02_05155 [Flavobacterium sp. RSP49]|uniref:Imm27 family immunity protein n=1 Tax=Flavobacterium sp. RSP49 TaxID=2497487 RepID=UPI000F81E859|nr:Imm27 family immunity protein [Flavobacterium sp. RSP49]RTZ01654.1 hypothetical protein EKM02_05155 [Flavobacterium sp. RSP49]
MLKNIILTDDKFFEKKKGLTKIKTDSSGWLVYYLDENLEKWIEEYPNSEYHGGGIPQLRLIDKFSWDK